MARRPHEISVAWMAAIVQPLVVSDDQRVVTLDDRTSAKGSAALQSKGKTSWCIEIETISHTNQILLGVCSHQFSQWHDHPHLETGAWVLWLDRGEAFAEHECVENLEQISFADLNETKTIELMYDADNGTLEVKAGDVSVEFQGPGGGIPCYPLVGGTGFRVTSLRPEDPEDYDVFTVTAVAEPWRVSCMTVASEDITVDVQPSDSLKVLSEKLEEITQATNVFLLREDGTPIYETRGGNATIADLLLPRISPSSPEAFCVEQKSVSRGLTLLLDLLV